MTYRKFSELFATIFASAVRLYEAIPADVLLVLLEGGTDWEELKRRAGSAKVIVVADYEHELEGAKEAGLTTIVLKMPDAPVIDKLTQALIESVADDLLAPGADVIAVYSGYEPDQIDSISYIQLDEHLGRLTGRDLRRLETSVPLDTLKLVVDLAVDIGREGREGKPVGTMFVVGDTRKVMSLSSPVGFDPVKGYSRKERDLRDPRVREAIKEVAQMDGAFIVNSDAVVEKGCQLIEVSKANITLSKGLGTRHWAAAAVTRKTKAIAVVVSESNGTVRLFQNGEVVLRIEPFRRAMKWKDFEYEPPPSNE